jgi:hypothetical protein
MVIMVTIYKCSINPSISPLTRDNWIEFAGIILLCIV